ncbi:hypothetical protein OAR19_00330 [bacterium]|nr:hypothetical protein [bacterium]
MIIKIIILITIAMQLNYASSTAGSFLDNPISAKSLALGNCSTALIDTSAAYKNPAVIKYFNKQAFNSMQGSLLNDVNYFNLTYLRPEFSKDYKFGLGFTLLNSSVEGIKEATYDSASGSAEYTGNQLSYHGRSFVFSFSEIFKNKYFLGLNLKIIQESMAGSSSMGTGLDFGFLYSVNDRILLGITAINLVKPELKWATGASDQTNSRFSIGLAYDLKKNITLFSDIEKIENQNSRFLWGIEYKPITLFAFRAGYSSDKLTLGTGFSYKNFSVDYAYVDHQDKQLGNNQYISATIIFEPPKDIEDIEKELAAKNILSAAVLEEQLKKELADKIASDNIEDYAEIEPLPLPPTDSILEELITDNEIVSDNIPSINPEEEIIPVEENVSGDEIVIDLIEEYTEPVYDYTIILMSARYFEETNKLLCKVFVDNTGNQDDTITANFNIYNGKSDLIKSFNAQNTNLSNEETKVFYFTLPFEQQLGKGNYYIETEIESLSVTKTQKEKYIKR